MKGRMLVVALIGIFILPVVVAKLVLEQSWYQKGVTNYGQFLAEPATLNWLPEQGQWRLIYRVPEQCDLVCEQALFQLTQIPIAVGKERDRVTSVALTSTAPKAPEVLTWQTLTTEQAQAWQQQAFDKNTIYLSDPMNNVVLAYPVSDDNTQWIAQGKGLLRDLKRLLKLSKVG
ncbi:hypothetical protein BZG78_03240 [Salinivibrio sp. MA351]|uniref:hypothetical protein n=1 Tax=unclassified Salinivibrio TaxID=2636825 RepID=UPI0009895434|nr:MULTISPECIES: hypothetical protein [unclassified Salinivibrio]NUY55373.1 hypothetical protein [Salinivibrio sp. EAGSL]OOF00931.1 hypothetical protein BZG78_03240 [Salinivibrio sp. MA351]OOF07211.1 hypothetical protein BZG81_00450 [Salinivibrio sp. MA607]OOF07430.1 hypothetical protein BZG80_02185 [Salinivibrio sp. MA440]OOF19612.1 hypothetical protein BZG79_02050 [Salinivibrio sp. MA427]